MIKFTVYKRETGEVLYSGVGQSPEVLETPTEGVALGVQLGYGWVDPVGQFHEMPEQPDAHHKWDWSEKVWTDTRTLEDFRAPKLAAVNSERIRRTNLVINYSGRSVDANIQAQSNIRSKIGEIMARESARMGMPQELMVWRDASNEMVEFETMAQMKEWLEGLTIEIAQRGTESYIWSWQMKELIASADSKEQLDAISW